MITAIVIIVLYMTGLLALLALANAASKDCESYTNDPDVY